MTNLDPETHIMCTGDNERTKTTHEAYIPGTHKTFVKGVEM